MKKFSKSKLAKAVLFSIATLISSNTAAQVDTIDDYTYIYDGKVIKANDMFYFYIEPNKNTVSNPSDYNSGQTDLDYDDRYTQPLINAANYWIDILKKGNKANFPLVYRVVTTSDPDCQDNAAAAPDRVLIDNTSYLSPLYTINGVLNSNYDKYSPVAYFVIGQEVNLSRDFLPFRSLVRGNTGLEMSATFVHEFTHSLGLAGSIENDNGKFYFSDYNKEGNFIDDPFRDHLYDYFGTKAQPGMEIVEGTSKQEGKFVVYPFNTNEGHGGAYFRGKNVDEVLNGALIKYPTSNHNRPSEGVPGVPVHCLESGEPEFGHIVLQNNTMSHELFANWGTMMEAELALLQDIGYDIDRRNFFGYSIYNDGEAGKRRTVVNNNPYFARNDEGTAYINGKPNTTAHGMGYLQLI